MSDGESAGTEEEVVEQIAAEEANQPADDGEWMNATSSEEGTPDEAAEAAAEPAEPVEAAAEDEGSVESEPEAQPAAAAPAAAPAAAAADR